MIDKRYLIGSILGSLICVVIIFAASIALVILPTALLAKGYFLLGLGVIFLYLFIILFLISYFRLGDR